LKKWNESHNPQGLKTVFTPDIITALNLWIGTTTQAITADDVEIFLLQKYSSVCIVDYDTATLRSLTRIWYLSNNYRFSGLSRSTKQDYNPIENYDRTETETTERTPDLSETETRNMQTADGGTTSTSGTTSDEQNADSVGKVAPYDSANFANAADSTTTATGSTSNTSTTTHGKTTTDTGTITHTHTGTDETSRELHAHGNIGLTSTQEMLKQEREIVDFNFLEVFFAMWIENVTCGVWRL
jgi:hypothetical protein